MASCTSRKRSVEGSVSLDQNIAKKKRTNNSTDYDKCVICQNKTLAAIHNVSSCERLCQAMEARKDDISTRLQIDIQTNDKEWLNVYGPKWHEKCRNWYINKKSLKLAEKKRQDENIQTTCSNVSECIAPVSIHPTLRTRAETQIFDAKSACVICNKRWMKGKEPKCKVSTEISQQSIIQKAKDLNRDDILLRLIGGGHDMIANDISYHLSCMNAFRATRTPIAEQLKLNLYEVAFSRLVEQIDTMLFREAQGLLIKSLRNWYRVILKELGVKTGDNYKSTPLKLKLNQHYGKRISIIGQSSGSGFICSSLLPLGDALAKLQQLETDLQIDENYKTLQRAAKILRSDCKQCKKNIRCEQLTEISFDAADKIIPDSSFNFTSMLLYDKIAKPVENSKRSEVDHLMKEKILILSQQLLQHTFGVPTPLSIATAYHLYNETRSKSLVTLSNRLHQSISYDTLHRQLTIISTDIMQQMEKDGIYIPGNITRNTRNMHVFALDNLDWRKKTLDGGSFHSTTAIIIENTKDTSPQANAIYVPTVSTARKKTLSDIDDEAIPPIYVTARDRQTSRSLQVITTLDSLDTQSDDIADDILLVWRIGRTVATSQLLTVPDAEELKFPGFSAFCVQLSSAHEAIKIGYLSIIPASPTDPAVMHEEMARLVKISRTLGDKYTVITGDQATYELARTIRDKYPTQFANVVLLLGGFHLAHNYLKAICKIVRHSGAENILVASGLCTAGTARKMFGEKADYYQSLHAIRLLSEVMWRLYWEAFETRQWSRSTISGPSSLRNFWQSFLNTKMTKPYYNLKFNRRAHILSCLDSTWKHLNSQLMNFQQHLFG